MSRDEHYRKLERMYRNAPCNRYFAPSISISDGECEVVIPVRGDFFHPGGSVHGLVYFKGMDDSAYFACNSLVEDVILLTVSFHVTLLRPVAKGELRARGRVVEATRQLLFGESVVYDSGERVIARGSGSFIRSRVALTPEIGYC